MTIEIPPAGTRGTKVRGGPLMRAGSAFFMRLIRLSGGRIGGGGMAILTTTGAKSGKSRSTVLGLVPDADDRWFVVASNTGSASHPAWLYNIAKHPDQVWLEVGKDRFKVRPEILSGDERAAAWQRVLKAASAYGKYETTTDREMPVVRLTREDAA
jgi:deazaflavin-dependent oxidoreductase (nitroreductase family)